MSAAFCEERLSLLEFLYRKPDLNVPELVEPSVNLGTLIREVFDDLQRTKAQLRGQVASLQARNRELEAYAYMVAHDLKEPLAVMVLTSNVVTHVHDLTFEEAREYLQQIKSTALEMDTIVNNLLLFAEVSQAEAPVERVDMARVVADILERFSYKIQACQARITLPEFWPAASGYAPWLKEVWANYLSNALKHGGQPPWIELGAATQPDGMIRFWLRDNGPGLLPETQAGIFTPYSQIGRVCNPGHGVGLSIALQIVEKLGGQVGVESELGRGSLFFFTLPAVPLSLRQELLPMASNST